MTNYSTYFWELPVELNVTVHDWHRCPICGKMENKRTGETLNHRPAYLNDQIRETAKICQSCIMDAKDAIFDGEEISLELCLRNQLACTEKNNPEYLQAIKEVCDANT